MLTAYVYIYMLWSYYLGQGVFYQFVKWFQAIFWCSVIILCFFCFQLSANFLKVAFSKKGGKIGFFKFLCFKFIFWKSSFLGLPKHY